MEFAKLEKKNNWPNFFHFLTFDFFIKNFEIYPLPVLMYIESRHVRLLFGYYEKNYFQFLQSYN
jgi:hypothetical protein